MGKMSNDWQLNTNLLPTVGNGRDNRAEAGGPVHRGMCQPHGDSLQKSQSWADSPCDPTMDGGPWTMEP